MRSRGPLLAALILALAGPAVPVGASARPGGADADAPAGKPAGAQAGKPAAAPAPADLIGKGQALFDDQQYEESVQTLSAALLRPSNTPEQRVEIYRLLALNYITLNRKDEAESAVRGLLAHDPDYALPASESPRFRDFFAQVRKRWDDEGRPGLVDRAQKPAPEPVTLRHQSPAQVASERELSLRGQVIDPGGRARAVRVYFRTGTSGEFAAADADVDARGNVAARIPASAVKAPIVEYYLVALGARDEALASRGDAQTPLRIAVSEGRPGWVLPLAIGGGILGAAAIVGGLALAGVFKGSDDGAGAARPSTVTINVGEAGLRFR